jgi:hypothetical protein
MQIGQGHVEAKREERITFDHRFPAARDAPSFSALTGAHDPIYESDLKLLYSLLFDLKPQRPGADCSLLRPEAEPLSETLDAAVGRDAPRSFPKNALVACQGAEGTYSQQAMRRDVQHAGHFVLLSAS